jgi:nicotinamidase-related amidase
MPDPELSKVVVLLVDVINGFDFEGAEGLVAAARRAAPKILALRERAHDAHVPLIYVNDGFGHEDFGAVLAASSETDRPGHNVARMLAPTENDHLLLKPTHSAFSCDELEPLLRRLGAQTLVIAGFATDICVLASVEDGHARGYDILVPGDCTAANSTELSDRALEQMRGAGKALTPDSHEIDLAALRYAVA